MEVRAIKWFRICNREPWIHSFNLNVSQIIMKWENGKLHMWCTSMFDVFLSCVFFILDYTECGHKTGLLWTNVVVYFDSCNKWSKTCHSSAKYFIVTCSSHMPSQARFAVGVYVGLQKCGDLAEMNRMYIGECTQNYSR